MSDTQPHRIEVEISGGHPHGLKGDITFKGVCDAEEGAPCRMWCDRPDCREEAQDGHENHPLVDQGECGVISSLNADPSFIPELYDGPKTQLRSDFIELTQDIDGVTWRYVGEPQVFSTEELTLLRGMLEELGEYRALFGVADTAGHTAGPTCAENCRHQCPECRMGLGSHLSCDPRCDHHQLAPSQ